MKQQHFANQVRMLRKAQGMTQEQLASRLGISVQAVSKWECADSYPDIEMLVRISEFFEVSVDALLKDDLSSHPEAEYEGLSEISSDGTVRILQVCDGKILREDEYDIASPIPLILPENGISGNVEIWGSVSGDVNANGNVECGNVDGNVVAVESVNCGDIHGDVSADKGSVACRDVYGDVNSGYGSVACKDVSGDVTAGSNVACKYVSGDVDSGGNISCHEIGGDIEAGGDVTCGDVEGDVNAGENVNCDDVDGDVSARGNVTCGDIGGDVTSGGSIER